MLPDFLKNVYGVGINQNVCMVIQTKIISVTENYKTWMTDFDSSFRPLKKLNEVSLRDISGFTAYHI